MTRYCADPMVDRAVAVMVNDFKLSPLDWRGTNDCKTVAAIVEAARKLFGDFARRVSITVH